jgi:hypothetical protein
MDGDTRLRDWTTRFFKTTAAELFVIWRLEASVRAMARCPACLRRRLVQPAVLCVACRKIVVRFGCSARDTTHASEILSEMSADVGDVLDDGVTKHAFVVGVVGAVVAVDAFAVVVGRDRPRDSVGI